MRLLGVAVALALGVVTQPAARAATFENTWAVALQSGEGAPLRCVWTLTVACCDAGIACAPPEALPCIASATRATRIDLRTTPAGWERLCIYEGSTPRRLLVDATIPAAGTCGTRPCWRRTPTAATYRRPDGVPDGIGRLVVRVGPTGTGPLTIRKSPVDPAADQAFRCECCRHSRASARSLRTPRDC